VKYIPYNKAAYKFEGGLAAWFNMSITNGSKNGEAHAIICLRL